MDVSLSSPLNNCNLYTTFSRPKGSSGYKSFCVVSCRNVADQSKGRSMNFHRVLSAECRNASADEIKRAYRKMALQYHPDVCDPSIKEESTKMFVELQEAYRNLLNQALQEDYCKGIGLEGNRRAKWLYRWESQIFELKRRSENQKCWKDGSWGCRMRAKT